MSINYYDDPNTLGYWFDEDNGISQHYGIFHMIDILRDSNTFTTLEGNPIETWLMEINEGTEYKGIAYPELDGLYIARSGSKIVLLSRAPVSSCFFRGSSCACSGTCDRIDR